MATEVYTSENLNEKQMIAYDIMTDLVDKKVRAATEDQEADEDVAPILIHINGKGGSGKSFFLHTLNNYIKERTNKPGFMAIMAPTGTAAFNVNGTTSHAALTIPIQHSTKVSRSMRPLSKSFESLFIFPRIHAQTCREMPSRFFRTDSKMWRL